MLMVFPMFSFNIHQFQPEINIQPRLLYSTRTFIAQIAVVFVFKKTERLMLHAQAMRTSGLGSLKTVDIWLPRKM